MATPILPEENLNDIYKIVNQFSPLEDFCSNLSSNDALKSSCSCYIAALGTMKEKLVQWGEYYQNKFLRETWLDDQHSWEQRERTEREAYTKKRSYAGCGACGTQPNCNKKSLQGNWENTGHRTGCNLLGCKSECKYSTKGLNALMATWRVANPPPREVDQATPPQNFGSNNFQCCTNIISDVTVENSGEILQECSQEIINNLSPEAKEEEEKQQQELSDLLIGTKTAAELLSQKKTLALGLIIFIIVLILLIIIIGVVIILGKKKSKKLG